MQEYPRGEGNFFGHQIILVFLFFVEICIKDQIFYNSYKTSYKKNKFKILYLYF